MSNPIQVDLEALLRSNKPPLKKQNGPGELLSSKESSNMLRSTIVGSITSTNNLTFSIINQDSLVNDFSSLHNTNKSKQSHHISEDINEPSSHADKKYHPKINIIPKSNQDDDIDYHNELMQKCPYVQDNNNNGTTTACKKTLGKDFFRSCGKLETIQETNSEISCLKKDALSTPNYNSSGNINNNFVDERNFFSKAESILHNFNAEVNNTSQDEEISFLSPNVSTVKEIEHLFEDKNSFTKHDNNNSECLTRGAIQIEETNNHITNNSEITMRTNGIKSNIFKVNTDDKEQSCSNIVCDISIKNNKHLRDECE